MYFSCNSTITTSITTAVTTTPKEELYEDECNYGIGWSGEIRCGDQCVFWQTPCICGNVTMAFLKLDISHYCCAQSSSCVKRYGSVYCPHGKVLDISEQCGDQCYNDWGKSKVLDPLQSNFKCVTSQAGMPECLPTTEMCQGLDICGEVDICNKHDLRCPTDWELLGTPHRSTNLLTNSETISRQILLLMAGTGSTTKDITHRFNNRYTKPKVTVNKLNSEMTTDHHYCHYDTYFDNDLEYDYINRQDEAVRGSKEDKATTIIDYSALLPCKAKTWENVLIGSHICKCFLPGVKCPRLNLYTTFSDSCLPMVLWCKEDNQFSCQLGNTSIKTGDDHLCKNYTFWRSMHENLSFDILSNRIEIKSLSCRGTKQKIYLPWYYNSFGSFDGLLTAFKGTCEDQSEKVHSLHSQCNTKLYLQQYNDLWCGAERDSKLMTRCAHLHDWFSSQLESLYTDPHSCQHSCLHPDQNCEACTNPDYFTCEESQVCIHPALVCDGHPQCQFGEDEQLELCSDQERWVKRGVVEPYASFTCRSLMYPGMTTVATACDGINECYDGSDEGSCSDQLSVYFLLTSTVFVVSLYLVLKFSQDNGNQRTRTDKVTLTKVRFTFKSSYSKKDGEDYFDFIENHEDENTIKRLNITLLQMIFTQKRDCIKEQCIAFYDLVAEAKKQNESATFCYLHNNFDSHIVKEISKAKFPGLTEKITDKIEKLAHSRFITKFQDELTENAWLDEQLSTLNTTRKVVSSFLDFFKDSYLALYLLVICGGPKALIEYMSNFTSVIILCLMATIIIPIITSSVHVAIKNPHLVFTFVSNWKAKTVGIVCFICGPLIPIFLLHNLQTTLSSAKHFAKTGHGHGLILMREYTKMKNLLASTVRIELGRQ